MKVKIYPNTEYMCIKSNMDFIKGIVYKSYLPETLCDSDGANMHISDKYFDEHFIVNEPTPIPGG